MFLFHPYRCGNLGSEKWSSQPRITRSVSGGGRFKSWSAELHSPLLISSEPQNLYCSISPHSSFFQIYPSVSFLNMTRFKTASSWLSQVVWILLFIVFCFFFFPQIILIALISVKWRLKKTKCVVWFFIQIFVCRVNIGFLFYLGLLLWPGR